MGSRRHRGCREQLKLIEIDDASDPSAAARAAKKLIEEDHVDVILGAASTPASMAVYGVSSEAKVPLIITANGLVAGDKGAWEITIPQPPELMVAADIPMMQKAGVKTVAYIGYSDAWGDLVYNALLQVKGTDIKVIANERYARTDTSVTPQILKIIAMHPDAVLTGGSGSVGALPHIALAERGYRGHVYSTHAIINSEFVRVGGAAVEGLIAPTGTVVVAEQLPDRIRSRRSRCTSASSTRRRTVRPLPTPSPCTRMMRCWCCPMRSSAWMGQRSPARRNTGTSCTTHW